MKRRLPAAIVLCLLALSCAAQNGKPQREAEEAYKTEMEHETESCGDAVNLADRNECLVDIRDETYKNYTKFFNALREALIQASPNDSNALALDGTERAWEKYRSSACDAMVRVYDMGTIKHPGPSGPNAQVRCLIQLTRSRMRDLKLLYEPTL
jgi:uncharacterized protein YecT (DUF1311 family)